MWYFHIIIITYVLELELGSILNVRDKPFFVCRTVQGKWSYFPYNYFNVCHVKMIVLFVSA